MKFLHSQTAAVILLACSSPTFADDTVTDALQGVVDTIQLVTAGTSAEIEFHGVCREIKNNGPAPIMVPTKTPLEWSTGENAFLNNISGMEGVSVGNCAPPAVPVLRYAIRGTIFPTDGEDGEPRLVPIWPFYVDEDGNQAIDVNTAANLLIMHYQQYVWLGEEQDPPQSGICRFEDGSPAITYVTDEGDAFYEVFYGDFDGFPTGDMARPLDDAFTADMIYWADFHENQALSNVELPDQGICTAHLVIQGDRTYKAKLSDGTVGDAKPMLGFTYVIVAPDGTQPSDLYALPAPYFN